MLNEINLAATDLNLLVLFEAVFVERHVGRAARRLNLTPSAVSHGLGRLRRLLSDPLFLRTPKGVVATSRAAELAGPISEILGGARSVVASAQPFDSKTSKRRFTIGAPDGVSAVILTPLVAELARLAPGVDLGVRQLLPTEGGPAPERAWQSALSDLEARALDVAVLPLGRVPARFSARSLYNEDFAIAMRAGHPFAGDPGLERFCNTQHLVVSLGGDAYGFVDEALAKRGRSRRVALTVPSFMLAMAVLAETDLIGALPRRFVAAHASRFGIVAREAPLPLPPFRLHAIASRAALMDAGVTWLVDAIARAAPEAAKARRRPRSPRRHSRL